MDGDGSISREHDYITLRFNALAVPSLTDRFCVHDLRRKMVTAINVKIVPIAWRTLPNNLMTCILEEDLQRFLEMDQALQVFGETSTDPRLPFVDPHLPYPTELCMALVQGNWCRSVFIELYGTSKVASVYALDYGIIASVDVDDIRVRVKRLSTTYIVVTNCPVNFLLTLY